MKNPFTVESLSKYMETEANSIRTNFIAVSRIENGELSPSATIYKIDSLQDIDTIVNNQPAGKYDVVSSSMNGCITHSPLVVTEDGTIKAGEDGIGIIGLKAAFTKEPETTLARACRGIPQPLFLPLIPEIA